MNSRKMWYFNILFDARFRNQCTFHITLPDAFDTRVNYGSKHAPEILRDIKHNALGEKELQGLSGGKNQPAKKILQINVNIFLNNCIPDKWEENPS